MVRIIAGAFQLDADREPDECPICNVKIHPYSLFGRGRSHFYKADYEVLYLCPNSQCDELFIAYFYNYCGSTCLRAVRPLEFAPVSFSEHIRDISPMFCEIYSEADKAEKSQLLQICGVGYRKALEFLIKDYVKSIRPGDTDAIETAPLGTCINNYV